MKRQSKKLIYNIIILAIIATGIFYVSSRFVHWGNVEFTDDAQVRQQMVPVNSRVRGFITKVCFEEYQKVNKGDTLAIIEDAEYRLQLAQAQAEYSNAGAGRMVVSSSANTAANNIKVSGAGVEEVRTQLEHARKETERYASLLAKKAVTQQQYDNVEAGYKALKARYEQMAHMKETSSLVYTEQTKRMTQSEAGIKLAEARVNLARLNLSYTVITAPCDGYVGKKEVLDGQLIEPGQNIANIVCSDKVWVTANYRETQLKNIGKGTKVDITVDAIPDVVYHGTVERISGATQASYSPFPVGNSAGNFVKVEQRVPVRIVFSGDNRKADMEKLRSGLNVECTIHYTE